MNHSGHGMQVLKSVEGEIGGLTDLKEHNAQARHGDRGFKADYHSLGILETSQEWGLQNNLGQNNSAKIPIKEQSIISDSKNSKMGVIRSENELLEMMKENKSHESYLFPKSSEQQISDSKKEETSSNLEQEEHVELGKYNPNSSLDQKVEMLKAKVDSQSLPGQKANHISTVIGNQESTHIKAGCKDFTTDNKRDPHSEKSENKNLNRDNFGAFENHELKFQENSQQAIEETNNQDPDQTMQNIIQRPAQIEISNNIENQESERPNLPERQFGFQDPQSAGQQPNSNDSPYDEIQSPNLDLDPSLKDPFRDTEEENEEVVYAIRTNIETIVEYSDLLLKIIQEDFFEEALRRINHLKQIPTLVKESLDKESEIGGWSVSFLRQLGLSRKDAMQMVLGIGSRDARQRTIIAQNQNQNTEIGAHTRNGNPKQTLSQFSNVITQNDDREEDNDTRCRHTLEKPNIQQTLGSDQIHATMIQELTSPQDLNTPNIQNVKSDVPNNPQHLSTPNIPKLTPTSISSPKSNTTISNMDNFATINEDLESKTQSHIKSDSSLISINNPPQSLHIWEYPSKPYLALPKEVFLKLTEKILSSYADSNIQQNLFDIQKIFHRSIFDAFNESLSEYVFRLRVCSVIPAEIDLLRKVRFDGDDLMFALNKAKYLLTEKASEMVGFLLNKEDSALGIVSLLLLLDLSSSSQFVPYFVSIETPCIDSWLEDVL